MHIDLQLSWSSPVEFECSSLFPDAPGIYAIIANTDAGYSMARIGAARNLSSRPSNYHAIPLLIKSNLMVSYSVVTEDFRDAMSDLIYAKFPLRIDDLNWLEYRIEYLALETFRKIWGQLPPGNYQEGSKREYMTFIKLNDGGCIKVLSLPPASLESGVLAALKQNRKTGNSLSAKT